MKPFVICLFCLVLDLDFHFFGEEEKEYLWFKQRKCRLEIFKDRWDLDQEAQRCIWNIRHQKKICNTKNVIGKVVLYFRESNCKVDYENFKLRCEVKRKAVDFLCEKIEERYHNYREMVSKK